ncbi:hypothetical protein KIN20_012818 [Parelaphostrongylus tenuis]|uniref:Uncharacterized protein n=1 Tax=Parelaphostrongylus tenuis TaxID=148309 RepID=A0AAD5QND8_PARTN|nr:hypothetical protein KIN20_012818 [Parelaphostrongylus tenuis]
MPVFDSLSKTVVLNDVFRVNGRPPYLFSDLHKEDEALRHMSKYYVKFPKTFVELEYGERVEYMCWN